MKINFILPHQIRIPMGGIKVVHKLAMEISKIGVDVEIIVPNLLKNGFKYRLKYILFNVRDFFQGVRFEPYYKIPKGVNYKIVEKISSDTINKSDYSIFVGAQAILISKLSIEELERGNYFHLIQGMEYQGLFSKKIHSLWNKKISKIIVSKWLTSYISNIERKSKKIGPILNAVDNNEFYLKHPIISRKPSILFCYHRNKCKGSVDAMKIVEWVHEHYSTVDIRMYCSRKPLIKLPSWIKVSVRPNMEDLNNLYNQTSIFLHTSNNEGWGLPPMEAMACGSALVAYRNNGILEYAKHNHNSLLSEIEDINQCQENIVKLLMNDDLRNRISQNGIDTVSNYSYCKSAKNLLQGLNS